MGMVVEEQLLRRVVREELSALLGGLLGQAVAPRVEPAPVALPVSADPEHPFLLSDAELCQAERIMSLEEGRILRQRVMAARMAKKGHHAAADKMRRKADRMERQLQLISKS